MDKKEFVLFTEALALKAMGFDGMCFGYYDDQRSFGKEYPKLFTDTCKRNSSIGELRGYNICTTPLYQQAFDFLLKRLNDGEELSNRYSISYDGEYYSYFLGGCNMGVFRDTIGKTGRQLLLEKLIKLK